MRFLILIAVCLGTQSWAQAGWPKSVLQTLMVQELKARHMHNSAVATFWGGYRRYLHFSHNRGEQVPLKSLLFKSGAVDIYLSDQQRPAPLFVFLPGIFGQPGQGLTPQTTDLLEAIGGHVLVVPNLLSPRYVASHPLYGADPIALETQVMDEALTYALGKLGTRATSVHVVAESLGTAIASAWVAKDRQTQKRTHSLTLLWPPLDLSIAMKNFDRIIDEHRPAARDCGVFRKLWVIGSEFTLQDYPGPLSKYEEDCLGGIVLVDGFVNATKRSWKSHVEVTGATGDDPTGFEDFFRKYRPELWNLIEHQDERLKLTHWMSVIRQDESYPVRLMTSKNDFLNRGLDWQAFKETHKLHHDELIIMSWGGHSGPIGMPKFEEILRQTFSAANGISYSSH